METYPGESLERREVYKEQEILSPEGLWGVLESWKATYPGEGKNKKKKNPQNMCLTTTPNREVAQMLAYACFQPQNPEENQPAALVSTTRRRGGTESNLCWVLLRTRRNTRVRHTSHVHCLIGLSQPTAVVITSFYRWRGFPGGSAVRICLPTQEMQETWVRSLGPEHPLE